MSQIWLNNTMRLVCFTVLAIVFKRWWIVLFVLLVWLYVQD